MRPPNRPEPAPRTHFLLPCACIRIQVEECEYELEELQGSVKKKQKPPPRLTELEELVTRHKEHVLRLEKVLRCIDNETITPDELEDLKNDMEMYLVRWCE